MFGITMIEIINTSIEWATPNGALLSNAGVAASSRTPSQQMVLVEYIATVSTHLLVFYIEINPTQ